MIQMSKKILLIEPNHLIPQNKPNPFGLKIDRHGAKDQLISFRSNFEILWISLREVKWYFSRTDYQSQLMFQSSKLLARFAAAFDEEQIMKNGYAIYHVL